MKHLIFLFICIPLLAIGQDDLLSEIDTGQPENEKVSSVFKGLKIVNFESTKLVAKKELTLVISHRFGTIKNGFNSFFGLDDAVTRIHFIYGVTNWLNIGASRSSFQKIYEGSLKVKLISQRKRGIPVTVVAFGSATINTALDEANLPLLQFENRLGYTAQLLISSKITKGLSIEAVPTFFHENFVVLDEQENSQYALGVGGRLKISKRWSINVDYGYHFNRAENSPFKDPLSIGFDLETGGHVFQMHFTNAQPMNVNGFLGQATGDWSTGDIYFGFNLSRVF